MYDANETLRDAYVLLIPHSNDATSVFFQAEVNGNLVTSSSDLDSGEVLYLTDRSREVIVDQSIQPDNGHDFGSTSWRDVGDVVVNGTDDIAELTIRGSGDGPVSLNSIRLQRREVSQLNVLNLSGNALNERAQTTMLPSLNQSVVIADRFTSTVQLPTIDPLAIDATASNISWKRTVALGCGDFPCANLHALSTRSNDGC